MQDTFWYPLLAVGALVAPFAGRAQMPQPKIRKIATLSGVAVAEAVRLPNGRVVLYTVGDSIVAYDVKSKHSTLVTRGFAYQLTVSPSGDHIAFVRETEDRKASFIAAMPIDPNTGDAAGPARRVSAGTGDSPSFSPDGKLIAFAVEGPAPVRQNDLAVVPASGGAERILAKYPVFINETYWGADGKWVFAQIGDRHAIERVPAAGGLSERVISYPGQAEGSIAGTIAFFRPGVGAPFEGRMAYITATGANGEFRIPPGAAWGGRVRSARAVLIHTTRAATAHLLDLEAGSVRDLPGAQQSRGAVWSPDSRRLALLESTVGHDQIVVLNADSLEPWRYPVTVDPATASLRWSPNGQLLAYYSGGGATTLALLDPITRNTHSVFSAPDANYIDFIWRPDGKSIVLVKYSALSGEERREVYEARLDGTAQKLRDIEARFGVTKFVSDQLIVGELPQPGPNPWAVIPTGGGAAIQLPGGPGSRLQAEPGVSNDGRWLLFLIRNADQHISSIELMSSDGDSSHAVSLSFEPDRVESPAFLADGRHIVLAGRAPGDSVSKIFLVPLDGTAPRALATLPGTAVNIRLALSPDGSTLVYSYEGVPTSTIYELDLSPLLRAIEKH